MYNFEYVKPSSLSDALHFINEHDGCGLIAGGTDVMIQFRRGKYKAAFLVDLLIDELTGIRENSDNFTICASTSLTQVSDFFLALPQPYCMLHQAAESVGSCLTRNLATLAGNICTGNASSDMATALLALEASLKIRSVRGERLLPVDDFFISNRKVALEADELVTEIIIPRQAGRCKSLFSKTGKRRGHVIAIFNLAVLLSKGDDGNVCKLRLAAGTLAEKPLRLYNCEKFLTDKFREGRSLDEALSGMEALMLSEIRPRDSFRASKEYRELASPAVLDEMIREVYSD